MHPLKKILPVIGLLSIPAIYLVFFATNTSVFATLGLSQDNLLVMLGVLSLIVWIWSAINARSQNKFMKKREQGNFPLAFGINSASEAVALLIWFGMDVAIPDNPDLSNPVAYMSGIMVFVLASMLLLGNFLRIFLSKIFFESDFKTTLNSLKFVLFTQVLLYGLASASFIFAYIQMSSM
jgi:hypothetical protein